MTLLQGITGSGLTLVVIHNYLKGMVQLSEAWKSLDFSNGCLPETQLSCSDRDVFKKYTNKKLIDIRDQEEETGQILFVRLAPSGSAASSSTTPRMALTIMLPIVITFTMVLGCYVWYVRRYKKQNREGEMRLGEGDLPFFEFKTVANATNNFSLDCKLGEGGFGPVYKGILGDGQEIAVKRHSKRSTQGVEEFKNEVSCIAKLQHRNLVRLLGWSTEEGERMLIYEYMPNKSLDYFIFGDVEKRALLDWPKRQDIINGIARGLLYLHQDSRLRVIRRDLKASNILLDYDKNPKISDFGMARSFGGSETEANTARVVGTYGYMSPEYALEGGFSVKSDVYSFGVLVIEMVSGMKNRFFNHPDHNLNLLGHLIEVSFSYPNREDFRLSNVDVGIDMGTRVAIVGPNGAGKSTLLNLLAGDLVPSEGEMRRSQKLRVGRYSQHFVDLLTMEETPVEYLLRLHPDQEGFSKQEAVRAKLGKYGLPSHNHVIPIAKLSGGQKARVVFTSISMSKPHILLLDEPTNHLDMQSIDALADALDEFTGGVVLVSHDSRLISRVCGDEEKSEIWVVENGTVEKFPGTFDEYKEELQQEIRAEVDD